MDAIFCLKKEMEIRLEVCEMKKVNNDSKICIFQEVIFCSQDLCQNLNTVGIFKKKCQFLTDKNSFIYLLSRAYIKEPFLSIVKVIVLA